MGARFRNLEVWKDSIKLVKIIYDLTRLFPESEKYGLSSQIQRASISIPSNIAEGSGRGTRRDFIHFLNLARGSLYEVISQVEIAFVLSYITESTRSDLIITCERLAQRINALINSVKGNKNNYYKPRATNNKLQEELK